MKMTCGKVKLAGAIATLVLSLVATQASAYQETYADNGRISFDKYRLVNSQWNKGSITNFWQKIWYVNNNWMGWQWDWPQVREGDVKSYPNIVSGRLWDWEWTNNSGFPVQLSWNKNIWTSFGYSTYDFSGKFNVSYDIWLDDTSNNQNPGTPTDEIMIWVANYNMTGWGNWEGKVSLEGANWNVYRTWNPAGWWYYAFLKEGNWITDKNNMNLKAFTDYCRNRGWISSSKYINSVAFGAEAVYGKCKVDVWKYKCDIQW